MDPNSVKGAQLGVTMVGWLAFMVRHELQVKPYKVHSAPLDGYFDAAAIWIPVLLVLTGAFAGGWVGRRSLPAVPFAAALVSWVVALGCFGALWWSAEPHLPADGDFGSAGLWQAMYSFLRHDGLVTVMIAASISLVLRVAEEPKTATPQGS